MKEKPGVLQMEAWEIQKKTYVILLSVKVLGPNKKLQMK